MPTDAPHTRSDLRYSAIVGIGILAGFLTALHRPAPAAAPAAGRGRGGSLHDCEEQFASGLAAATEVGLIPDADTVREVWRDAVSAPEWTGPRVWLHADLHPANVLTAGGTFGGVIDFGDLCAGDPGLRPSRLVGPATGRPQRSASMTPTDHRWTMRPCAAPAAGPYGVLSAASSSVTLVFAAAAAAAARPVRGHLPKPRCNV